MPKLKTFMRGVTLGMCALACTCGGVAAGQVIVNGDFELGNSGFATSYTYSSGPILLEGTYTIVTDPSDAHPYATSYGDHTTGSGLMMAVNGDTDGSSVVWSQTAPVLAGAQYEFVVWISSWTSPSPANLDFLFNGASVGTFVAPSTTGQWVSFETYWDSGANTSVTIQIVDRNSAASGNDFALDDISLMPTVYPAVVDVDPNTLNLKSEGNYATTYIELPEGLDPADIDVSTVTFEDVLPAMPSPTSVGDYDGDTIPDLMVKFNLAGVLSLLSDSEGSSLWVRDLRSDIAPLNHGDEFEVTVSGQLADGRMFSGTDVIRVINPGSGSDDATVLNVCPSPLNATASISYQVLQEGHVSLRVYDVAGRLVCTLVSGHRGAGRHKITWDRKADDDQPVATGVYFLRLEQRGEAWVEKALVVN